MTHAFTVTVEMTKPSDHHDVANILAQGLQYGLTMQRRRYHGIAAILVSHSDDAAVIEVQPIDGNARDYIRFIP
jgi:hypothetical protein